MIIKNQLVESNANGNIIIKATTEGRIESLTVTKGQMVDKRQQSSTDKTYR